MRVLVTGAEGVIGTAVREHLAERYELASSTLTPQEFPSHVADISDLAAIRPAFEKVDAVVHLAASAALEAPWDDVLRNNIVGTYNVFEAAREAGVARWCSRPRIMRSACTSCTAHPELYDRDDGRSYDHTSEIRPDSLYGVSKAYGEALGRMYMERHALRVFCLRIGAVRATDDPTAPNSKSADRPRRRRPPQPPARRLAEPARLRRADRPDASTSKTSPGQSSTASPPTRAVSGISTHAREVLGWEPQDAAPV